MKNNILTVTFCLMLVSLFAQKMNPKEYAIITQEMLSGTASRLAPMVGEAQAVFTPNADFMFMVDGSEEYDGNAVVYDLAKKKVVKRFKIKKTGIIFFRGKIICNPNNTNQLAIVLNKNTVKVIQNWQTAPEDILLQKTSENLVTIKAKVDKGQMAFSKDGKSLYLIENETAIIKSVDLASGVITKKLLPDGKLPHIHNEFKSFIGNDELVVYNQPNYDTKEPRIPYSIEIFNLATNSFVRKYELGDVFGTPSSNSYGNPHIIRISDITLNLLTGEKDDTYKKIAKSVKQIEKDANITLSQIPGIGFIGNYFFFKQTESSNGNTTRINKRMGYGLFFYDKSGNDVFGDFPSVNSKAPETGVGRYQISPNGKYVVFYHDDYDNMYNSRLVIATLY